MISSSSPFEIVLCLASSVERHVGQVSSKIYPRNINCSACIFFQIRRFSSNLLGRKALWFANFLLFNLKSLLLLNAIHDPLMCGLINGVSRDKGPGVITSLVRVGSSDRVVTVSHSVPTPPFISSLSAPHVPTSQDQQWDQNQWNQQHPFLPLEQFLSVSLVVDGVTMTF